MRSRGRAGWCAIALWAAATGFRVAAAGACCTALPPDNTILIADQEVLIVWDAETGTEHFIRRASFQSGGKPSAFGFLVPTPSIPELATADNAAFDHLREMMEPKIVTVHDVEWSLLLAMQPRMGLTRYAAGVGSANLSSRVLVISQSRVGAYEATVLEADDPAALMEWLGDHGFEARPEVQDWVTPYVESRWKITAFSYKPLPGNASVATEAVRMTFATDRPVFPYRVPSDNRTGGSTLRLFYIGEGRGSAMLGGSAWGAPTVFAARRGKDLRKALKDAVPEAGKLPAGSWLSVFEDETWPGGKDDLYFQRATEQASIEPPPFYQHKKVLIPLDVMFVLGSAGLLAVWGRRRR